MSNELPRNNKKMIYYGLITGLTVMGSPAILADDNKKDEDAVEIIEVRGIRDSLNESIAKKKEAIVISDGIAAEDLGKFPDQNVAESLQRITGISIDRSAGEGQFVSARGFGPEFNTVLVNGRQIATENEGREFSFDILATELIRSAEVYKTPDAKIQDGGIGATINITTARPFDMKGMQVAGSAKSIYSELSGDNSPQMAGLFSNTYNNDTLGVLLSFAHTENYTQTNMVDTRGYRPGVTFTTAAGDTFENAFVPQNFDQIVDLQERTRSTGSAVLQLAPNNDIVVTVDTFYSRFQADSDAHSLGHWFTDSQFNDAQVDANNTVTFIDHNNNGATDFIRRSFGRDVEVAAYGLNLVWDINTNFTATFDLSGSSAEDMSGGDINFNVIGFNNPYSFDNTKGGIPLISFAGQNSKFDTGLGRAHYVERNGWDRKDEISEFKSTLEWNADKGNLSKVTTVLYYQNREKNNQRLFSDPASNCLYCGYATDVPDALLQPFNARKFFSGVPNNWLTYDPEAYFAYLESDAGKSASPDPAAAAAVIDANNGYLATVQPDRFVVEEEVFSANFNFLFEGLMGDLPWALNAGFRYSQTDAVLSGEQQTLLDLEVIPEDETMLRAVFADDGQPITADSDYSEFLPDVNFRLDIAEDMIIRAAFSKTLTRPTMGDLAPRTSINTTRPNNLEASGGNAQLRPFVSTNFDLSYEWYYGDASYFAAATFRKEVDDFITSIVAEETFNLDSGDYVFDVRRPRNGDTATVNGLELAWTHTLTSGFGLAVNATFVDSDAELDLDNITESFALEGLGDSQNIVAFYDGEVGQVRVAYNNRDSFMQTLSNGTGGDPIFVDDYGQWDISGSYDIDNVWSVFFEGVNVTGETITKYGRFQNQILRVEDTGARWAIGVRGSF